MNITCDNALALASQTELSGPVYAARYHLWHCAQCSEAFRSFVWGVVYLPEERLATTTTGVDLDDTVCEPAAGMITWLARRSRRILASVVQSGQSLFPSLPMTPVQLGSVDQAGTGVVYQDVQQTADGRLKCTLTYRVDPADPAWCTADVQVDLFEPDRSDLAGTQVLLVWDDQRRLGTTNTRGHLQLAQIPTALIHQITVVVHPSYLPTDTNAPQK